MTQLTVSHTRPAPHRRPGARDKSSWQVPLALIVLSLIPVVAGSLRLVEIAGGPQLLPTNPRIDASPAPVVVHVLGAALNVAVAEWVIRRPSVRRARRARAHAALAGSL
jgi:hypothetical protein